MGVYSVSGSGEDCRSSAFTGSGGSTPSAPTIIKGSLMNIAIDYDDTYTKDPDTWLRVISILKSAGHNVYCVTMRHPNEFDDFDDRLIDICTSVICTCRQAKARVVEQRGIKIHVWIDDSPKWILFDAI